eukprot:TRINITY_DN8458_c0_g1_i1.p1 TRINITY_DN8458_c0_g1~~TRINITY_DN8458_c0_g1_i1.p1  ORF type:complete len:221 (-),score=50.68 TRINITY_DN8458_c0_g1_i1:41-703(-)
MKEIKKTFRKLSIKYHPDKSNLNSNKKVDPTIFRDISEAYSILSDKDSRKDYDKELQFYREYGRFMHDIRYNAMRQLTLYQVLLPSIAIFTILQYMYFYRKHVTLHKHAMNSEHYREECEKRERLKEELYKEGRADEAEKLEPLQVVVEGATFPTWSDLTLFHILLFPYFIYKCMGRYKEQRAEQEKQKLEWEKFWNSLTTKERNDWKKKYSKRYWRRQK